MCGIIEDKRSRKNIFANDNAPVVLSGEVNAIDYIEANAKC